MSERVSPPGGGITVVQGDVRDLPVRGPFHAILCDPPYELGFMGKSWDAQGVAYDADLWRGLLALLHPGGFGMAFGGSRTYHRLACAIEDAGAVLHPMIGWAYGSGFPKATRIDTQVDKAAGAEREVVGRNPNDRDRRENALSDYGLQGGVGQGMVTLPATPLASTWSGHRYGLQALKPALEPICCFQRPYAGKPWECITKTGAGALAIDAGRVGTGDNLDRPQGTMPHPMDWGNKSPESEYRTRGNPSGRWPANLILGHTPDCNGTCADGCAVRALGEQSGVSESTDRPRHNGEFKSVAKGYELPHTTYGHADSGTAARFFTQVGWQLEQAEEIRYQAKASRRERDAGLEGREAEYRGTMGTFKENPGCTVQKGGGIPAHNPHPTVKPIALARYLATLLLPPPEYAPRRILIPFGGSGSEAIGALLAGWEEVVLIEQDAEYCQIARTRAMHWTKQPELVMA